MKLLIIGHARHGKDTAAEYLAEKLQLKFTSSSLAAANIIFEQVRDIYGYETVQDCYNDRYNKRPVWHYLIAKYNHNDKTRLASLIYKHSDIYVGLRDQKELDAIREKFNPTIIWIDASERLPLEGYSSMNILYKDEFIRITNNTTPAHMAAKLDLLCDDLSKVVAAANENQLTLTIGEE